LHTIQEAISKLAIDRPEKEVYNPYREQDYLTPQWKDITTLLNNATNGKQPFLFSISMPEGA
jgi:hypothetical protein